MRCIIFKLYSLVPFLALTACVTASPPPREKLPRWQAELMSDPSYQMERARADWAEAQKRQFEEGRLQSAREDQDLVLGMPMEDVTKIWGEPYDVQVAGDPRYGNQKWVYSTGLSLKNGFGSHRVIFFESGRVAGWDFKR